MSGRTVQVIAAPSNLGLRPLRPGHEPGTWRAPDALFDAGLLEAVGAGAPIAMARPAWKPGPDPGTRLRNGIAMRAFNLALADHVDATCARGAFALVVGGDCSILLGALAGARRHGPLALVHVDGHSDFRHPGNHDPASTLDAVAGMDLALATGRGEALMTDWPDVNDTDIERIDVFTADGIGPHAVLARARSTLGAVPDQHFRVHLDVDVLDAAVMPAVDSPGSPGIAPDDLALILSGLLPDPRCAGMTVTVFDPDLDPDGRYARLLVDLLGHLPFH
ncbi:arginase family protein [Massilia sp. TW-1]|uniref:Arginase family protein n=1 Tax=Telluria antibiotica TaxID=2717319 RepID=A0ABX0PAU9_9BURK|nr:arginase family protein [Telluria antibiotica]NIA54457.1 arginase family protein [Telluria antibiotica]